MARYADVWIEGSRYRVELPGRASSVKEHRKMIAAAEKEAAKLHKAATKHKAAKKGKAKK